jgi:phage protein D
MNPLRQVGAVIVRGYDPKNKQEIVGRAGPGAERQMGGTIAGAEAAAQAFGPKEEVHVQSPIASQEEADQLAQALYMRRSIEFVVGSGSTIGIPELRVGRVIDLRGLGRFSGPYYVTQATHSISGGGYQTSFRVGRNAIS